MIRDPVAAPADATVQQFMDQVFLPTRHTAFPVLDDEGRPAGIMSFRTALELPRSAWPTVPVREIMAPAGERCVEPGAPLSEVFPRLATDELRRVLVCRDGELEGLLSFTDVARLMEVRTRAAWPAPEARGTAPARAPARPARVSWR